MPVLDPVVDGTNAPALAPALRRMANLADTATALDEIAALGVLGQRFLEPAVLLVAEQFPHLARERWRLDELHTVKSYTPMADRWRRLL